MASRRHRIGLVLALGAALAGASVLVPWLLKDDVAAYAPGEAVEGVTDTLARETPAGSAPIALADATREAGIAFTHFGGVRSSRLPEDMGSGAAWGDVDGDGDDDLFLPNYSASPAAIHRLYRNRGDGTFEDTTAASGLGVAGTAFAGAFADADGDGDLDLAISQLGRCKLHLNRGDGTFEDASEPSGVAAFDGFWTGLSWADFDRDGDLDLHVCGYVRHDPTRVASDTLSRQYGVVIPVLLNPSSFEPERNLLLRNDGRGRFEDVARSAGVDNPTGRSLSASWADFDEDGWLDLYVANDVSDNALFLNRGDGTFEDASHSAWVADPRGAMGLGVGDPDGDLDLDILVTHWIAQENALYRSLLRDLKRAPTDAAAPTANAALRFVDVADAVGLGHVALPFVGWGTDLVDLDNDGRVDALVVNGSTFQREDDPTRLVPQRSQVFWNAGGRKGFFEVAAASPAMAAERVGRGAAFSDYDADGDVDALVTVNGGDALLLRNDCEPGRAWLEVRLRGTRSPTDGTGSRVEVEAGGSRQVRVAGGSSSYLSQSSATTHFGLGAAAKVDVLEVRWTSGHVDVLRDLPARALVRVEEGGRIEVLAGPAVISPPAAPASLEAKREFFAILSRAQAARAAGDLDVALAGFREALARDPRHEDALYWLGNCLFEKDRDAEALAAWTRLAEANPLSGRAHQQLGAVLATPGPTFDLAAAEEHFRRAVEINREESGPFMRLGEVLLARGEAAEGEKWLGAAARLNPKAAGALYLTAHLRWKEGRREDAVLALRQAARALETDRAPARGATSEGDTQARLHDLQRAASRRSLFGPLWTDLRERHDPATIDERVAAAESARVDEFLAGLALPLEHGREGGRERDAGNGIGTGNPPSP